MAAARSSRKNALVPPPAFGDAYRMRTFRLRWAGGGADRLAWRTDRSGAMSLRKHCALVVSSVPSILTLVDG
eukprot:4839207-Prymnesium_polylepis.1